MKTINTSSKSFIKDILQAFKKRKRFDVLDDAKFGFSKEDFTSALSFLKSLKENTNFSWKEIGQILTGLGMTSAGAWLIRLAIADPEPTSKLWLLIGTGGVLLLGGFYSLLRIFDQNWDPKVSINSKGFNFSMNPI